MRLVILSGLSGSGKSVAINMLEDLGYYCIDNIPAGLLHTVAQSTALSGNSAYSRMAIGVDARNRPEDLRSLPDVVEEIRELGAHCEVVFLSADQETLFKRFSETRRRHPLSGAERSLRDAMESEREILAPISEHADLTIDTTNLTIHQLRSLIKERVHGREEQSVSLLFESFGYRHGIPEDADLVFDARCLPNPHWEPALRTQTGRDPDVINYLESHQLVIQMQNDIIRFLERWIPHFEANNRSYITVAIGCTGGQHRSVYLAESLATHFKASYQNVLVRHAALE